MIDTAQQSIARRYLAELPFDAEQQQALGDQAEEQGGELIDAHRVLAQSTYGEIPADGGSRSRGLLNSVAARLHLGWGATFERGQVLTEDHQGRTCVQSTPPIVRTRMVP